VKSEVEAVRMDERMGWGDWLVLGWWFGEKGSWVDEANDIGQERGSHSVHVTASIIFLTPMRLMTLLML